MNERWPFIGKKKYDGSKKRFKLRDRTETRNVFNKKKSLCRRIGQRSAGAKTDFQYILCGIDELPFTEPRERHCGISAIGVSCIYL